ncbi:MAG: ATP-binding cassette domain-containing protein [Planctomycetota bacterium]
MLTLLGWNRPWRRRTNDERPRLSHPKVSPRATARATCCTAWSTSRRATTVLLGRNGTGKSTPLKACLGVLKPSGSVRVLGLDPLRRRAEVLTHVGYVPVSPASILDASARPVPAAEAHHPRWATSAPASSASGSRNAAKHALSAQPWAGYARHARRGPRPGPRGLAARRALRRRGHRSA